MQLLVFNGLFDVLLPCLGLEKGDSTYNIKDVDTALSRKSSFLPAFTASSLRARLERIKNRDSKEEVLASFGLDGVVVTVGEQPVKDVVSREITFMTSFEDRICISDRSNENIQIPKKCSYVYLKNLSNCNVAIGPCSGAVFCEAVEGSQLRLSGHQLRLIKCHNLMVSCFVQTSVNLEECTEIGTNELSPWYPDYERDYKSANLTGPNMFNKMVNFSADFGI